MSEMIAEIEREIRKLRGLVRLLKAIRRGR
jgi:hypothetical protein